MKIAGFQELFAFEGFIIDKITLFVSSSHNIATGD